MVVTCCYLSPLSSSAETVARKETTSGPTEPQVDRFLSAVTRCVTSDFGVASGRRSKLLLQIDLMFEKGLDRRPLGEKNRDDEVFFLFGLLYGAVSIAKYHTIKW